jgi:hypothetical protein
MLFIADPGSPLITEDMVAMHITPMKRDTA